MTAFWIIIIFVHIGMVGLIQLCGDLMNLFIPIISFTFILLSSLYIFLIGNYYIFLNSLFRKSMLIVLKQHFNFETNLTLLRINKWKEKNDSKCSHCGIHQIQLVSDWLLLMILVFSKIYESRSHEINKNIRIIPISTQL